MRIERKRKERKERRKKKGKKKNELDGSVFSLDLKLWVRKKK